MSKKSLLDRHPWFPFALAFVALGCAWSAMIVIAVKNRPEQIPLEQAQQSKEREE